MVHVKTLSLCTLSVDGKSPIFLTHKYRTCASMAIIQQGVPSIAGAIVSSNGVSTHLVTTSRSKGTFIHIYKGHGIYVTCKIGRKKYVQTVLKLTLFVHVLYIAFLIAFSQKRTKLRLPFNNNKTNFRSFMVSQSKKGEEKERVMK